IGAGPAVKRYLDHYGAQGAKVLRHSAERDDLVTLYVRDETLQNPAKAAALAAYVRLWGRAQQWINQHPADWAKAYYQDNQGLSPELARYAVAANGETVVPARWDQAVALQQGSLELMARTTRRKPFRAATLFDRRFEPLAARGFAELREAAGVKLAALKEPTR
ncbi:MAG: hypothetical protein JWQ97_1829, partial [Phenylobacterium sp.]|nr:hypothetical protein [Phenylobacterium sp.]